jgi:hypothetical protein
MDYALVPTPKGWRVLNTGNMPNDQFGWTVHQAIENLESTSLPDTIEATRSHYVGDYISNDWSKSPNAENYLQTIGQAGPDVQRSADTLRASFWSQVEVVTESLQGAALYGAQLQGAYLRGAQLQGSTLDQADLQGASISYAQLQGAYLREAELQGASLLYAQLQGATLVRAHLQGADLREAEQHKQAHIH